MQITQVGKLNWVLRLEAVLHSTRIEEKRPDAHPYQYRTPGKIRFRSFCGPLCKKKADATIHENCVSSKNFVLGLAKLYIYKRAATLQAKPAFRILAMSFFSILQGVHVPSHAPWAFCFCSTTKGKFVTFRRWEESKEPHGDGQDMSPKIASMVDDLWTTS